MHHTNPTGVDVARSRVKVVEEIRLRLAPSATAELAAGALRAQEAAGLTSADFLIVAVPPGTALDVADAVAAAADKAVADLEAS